MKIYLWILSILFCTSVLFADTLPFKHRAVIELSYTTAQPFVPDSVGIIAYHYSKQTLDTIFGCHGATCLSIEHGNTVVISRGVPDTFRLVLCQGRKTLVSPLLKQRKLRSYYRLSVSDGGIEDITPFIGADYYSYLFALFITIAIEFLVAFIYTTGKGIPFSLTHIVVANILTHPLLWIVAYYYIGFTAANFLGEPMVVVVEALYLSYAMKGKYTLQRALNISWRMNLASWIVGLFISLL